MPSPLAHCHCICSLGVNRLTPAGGWDSMRQHQGTVPASCDQLWPWSLCLSTQTGGVRQRPAQLELTFLETCQHPSPIWRPASASVSPVGSTVFHWMYHSPPLLFVFSQNPLKVFNWNILEWTDVAMWGWIFGMIVFLWMNILQFCCNAFQE